MSRLSAVLRISRRVWICFQLVSKTACSTRARTAVASDGVDGRANSQESRPALQLADGLAGVSAGFVTLLVEFRARVATSASYSAR
jgi:hypothetical protein